MATRRALHVLEVTGGWSEYEISFFSNGAVLKVSTRSFAKKIGRTKNFQKGRPPGQSQPDPRLLALHPVAADPPRKSRRVHVRVV